MSELNIIPFIGMGIYRLDEQFDIIKNLLSDTVQITEKNKEKRIIDGSISIKFVDDKLCEFSILDDMSVFYNGLSVFSDTFHNKLKEDYDYVYKFGFLIFDEIGFALSGYVDKEEQKTITIYKKGGWDKIISLPNS